MPSKNSSASPPLPPLPSSLVAFVDVLGFTERVLNVRTQTQLDDIDQDMQAVQNHFDVDSEDEITREVHAASKKEVLAFSDCIVLSTSLQSELTQREGAFDALIGEVLALAISQASCIEDGVFVRGALELGPWHRAKNRLVSPALARAYHLERQAVVPVIRLSEDVTKFFRWHTHRYFYSDDYDPVPSSFLIYKDTGTGESFWFIDYLNLCINNLDWRDSPNRHKEYMAAAPSDRGPIMDAGYSNNVSRWLALHRDRIVTGYKSAKDARAKFKYRWLARYHNTIVQQYKPPLHVIRVLAREVPMPTNRFRIQPLPRRPRPTGKRVLDIRREQDKLAGAT